VKLSVRNLDNQEVGDIELADEVFGLPVRRDILARVVNWQLASDAPGPTRQRASARSAAPARSLTNKRVPAVPVRAACARRNSAAVR